MNWRTIGLLALITFFTGCSYDKEELLYPGTVDCSSVNASFTINVQPIIQASCAIAGCHDAASTNKGGPFTSYNLVKNKASIIKSQVTSGAMPQGATLSANQIKLISCWVNSGALNN